MIDRPNKNPQMFSTDSFVTLKDGLKNQDSKCQAELWTRYVDQLRRLARRYLGQRRLVAGDSEDAVLSAMNSFYRWVGNHPSQVQDQDHLAALLATFTFRKCRNHIRQQNTQKNSPDGQRVSLAPAEPCSSGFADDGVLPLTELVIQETLDSLLQGLSPEKLRIFELHLEGCDAKSISRKLGCSIRSVQRMLMRMRIELQQELVEA